MISQRSRQPLPAVPGTTQGISSEIKPDTAGARHHTWPAVDYADQPCVIHDNLWRDQMSFSSIPGQSTSLHPRSHHRQRLSQLVLHLPPAALSPGQVPAWQRSFPVTFTFEFFKRDENILGLSPAGRSTVRAG